MNNKMRQMLFIKKHFNPENCFVINECHVKSINLQLEYVNKLFDK